MKFKAGERVKIRDDTVSVNPLSRLAKPSRGAGKECVIVEAGCNIDYFPRALGPYYRVMLKGGFGEIIVSEDSLRKLLPDSDTYQPADVSVDDLMDGLRRRETA